MHTHVPMAILVQFAWFFKLIVWFVLLVTGLAARFINPGTTIGVTHIFHITMAILAEDTFRKMDISLAVGLKTWVTGVARITQ